MFGAWSKIKRASAPALVDKDDDLNFANIVSI